MFTVRQAAVRAFNAALSDRRWSAWGLRPYERDQLRDDHLQMLRQAVAAVDVAYAEPRMLSAEPDDARLGQMRARLVAELELPQPGGSTLGGPVSRGA